MIRLRGIDHIVLRVRDPQVISDFYCGVIGCEEFRRTGTGLTQLRAGATVIDLMTIDAATPPRRAEDHNLDHFCLAVEDFDAEAVMAHLRAHGVAVGRVTSRGSIFLNDPEGNRVELIAAEWQRRPAADLAAASG